MADYKAYSPEFMGAFYDWQKTQQEEELQNMIKEIKGIFQQKGLYTTGAMLQPIGKAGERYQTSMKEVGYRGALQKALAEREERMVGEQRAWTSAETEKERVFREKLFNMQLEQAKAEARKSLIGRIFGGLAKGAGYLLAPATGGLSMLGGEGLSSALSSTPSMGFSATPGMGGPFAPPSPEDFMARQPLFGGDKLSLYGYKEPIDYDELRKYIRGGY